MHTGNSYNSTGNSNSDTPSSWDEAPTNTNDNTNQDWPPALSQYVTVCFNRSSTLSERDKVLFNRQLQSLIETAVDDNLIWTNDWSKQKLPILDGEHITLELEKQKKKSKTSSKPIKKESNDSLSKSPSVNTLGDFDSNERKRQRMERFNDNNSSTPSVSTPISKAGSVIGRCTDLEKSYLRLTSEPDPNRVRNQQVLQKSLKFVQEKYLQTKNYSYALDQFRSIRQDLMVQNIKNDFTIVVYETNAKISLENDDLGQFNQCQSQLKYLYHLTRKNNSAFTKRFFRLEVEFLMYQVVYMMITFNVSEIFRIKMGILQQFSDFRTTDREMTLFKFIQTLFQCQVYITTGNYLRFFDSLNQFEQEQDIKLALAVLKKHLYQKFRVKSMSIITQSFRNYPVKVLTDCLGFSNYTECFEFLESIGLKDYVTASDDNGQLECHKCKHLVVAMMQKSNFKKVDIKGQI
ncbi:uncharacterized protein SPAPADRAFT_142098 [Spathaspora passalidarum NRRL Y-27907]|uniref:SAC3/GANP/THP3 conserved domain-containing protein n=1 Tax=Spathaspora passalidarum (strain NRRL Y-27907 / 11-Y1) TaxID=619300 RepID=G3AT89_SPAPN|nr:uncharacterized protein SPAPADRAFT_142098 [Spathaspora passalidarum NRRL Y-27907]EGW30852.1 hypothetical protein SPAPADRAFT_142098 [Spathaspora passalidarum NRRL Y-27907]